MFCKNHHFWKRRKVKVFCVLNTGHMQVYTCGCEVSTWIWERCQGPWRGENFRNCVKLKWFWIKDWWSWGAETPLQTHPFKRKHHSSAFCISRQDLDVANCKRGGHRPWNFRRNRYFSESLPNSKIKQIFFQNCRCRQSFIQVLSRTQSVSLWHFQCNMCLKHVCDFISLNGAFFLK